jgi:hypothetical protein
MHPLGRFIEDRVSQLGGSMAGTGRAGGLTRSRMSQLVNDPVKTLPGRDTINGLARALKVPPGVIVGLFLDSLQLPWPQPAEQGTAMPDVVRAHWGDPNVRKFWDLNVSVSQRLAYIERYLAQNSERGESAV